MNEWKKSIFNVEIPFHEKALAIFNYQHKENVIYRRFCNELGRDPNTVNIINSIPLLPVEAFKDAEIKTGAWLNPELLFKSSGTTKMQRSRHLVSEADLYRLSLLRGFHFFYDLSEWIFWGYTPGYSENPHSSLIWMLNELIRHDNSGLSHFLPLNEPISDRDLDAVRSSGKKLMLFGAAFGLLDLLEMHAVKLPKDSIIMETGGMKTHRREISRAQLHQKLASGFSLPDHHIHSEYGMTELLSQAYSKGNEWFQTPPWMQISIRNPDDPLATLPLGEEGLIGIIDLANVHSCSFLLTKDVGIQREDGKFQVNGRWKHANLRGCNFLIEKD